MSYKNIRSIREDNDVTQRQVAELLNVSQNTYSQYETGKIEWTASTLIKLADYFDVSVDYLLDRTKNKGCNK
ncbi:helix-turn-helix domain-containing protein [Tetragenococcus halophilus]|uniref:Helix-turn-helix protein n=2 Tax=Tetragenococcus halophilus TaxID=51669 RepID=A0A2H6D2T6_TETHA|nr:helix-turn-helix transcriptional regulator [Tetragenococcus halophilus]MCO7027580.1 helix-turn-helix domain-containing protein [Tetragenococcus halophilus]NRR74809.1 helix-turn-helix transcriptional regulator [Tetragenococcus halophilus]NWO01220.1 helix-turn-helix transcriptional regulator [Tetragenococcus halophilus]QXN86723.1 helix-turn-helix domain-containing protein [Tetragenococcus halophilus]RQD29664.1 XRE family transcriptional regulator [Tetragenococcus halophilus subsp. halophilus 